MEGWQASGDTGIIEYIATSDNWNNAVLDANVNLGINRVRIGLHSGAAENTTDYYGAFLAGGQNAPNSLWQSVMNNWRVPVNDNSDPNTINPAGFKWSLVDRQMDKIVVPMRQKLAARGETLFFQVTYVHFSTSNQLHINSAAEYGELILATWNHLNSKYGFVPDGLEIFLEPDNDTAGVTPAEMAAMINAARNRLVAAGYTKPVIVAPSTMSGPAARQYYLDIKAASATAASYIDEIGYHRYGDISNSQLSSLRSTADTDGKRLSMNEFGGGHVFQLWDDLETGKNVTWEQYALGFPETDNGYQYFYINSNFSFQMGKYAKYFQHFFKYIRRGAVMKGVTNSNANFKGLPFRNANGAYVVPIKVSAAGSVTVTGLPAGTYGIRRTRGDGTNEPETSFEALPNQTITAGQGVTFSVTGAGFATVYNISYLPASAFTMFETDDPIPLP